MARNAFRINTVVDAPEKRTQMNPNEPESFPATKLPLKSLPECGLALHFSPGFGKRTSGPPKPRDCAACVSLLAQLVDDNLRRSETW
jgi:hypothetical protein